MAWHFLLLHYPGQQRQILLIQQRLEHLQLSGVEPVQIPLYEPVQNQVQFQQATTALPANAVKFRHILLNRRLRHPTHGDHTRASASDGIRLTVDPPAGAPRQVAHTVRLTRRSLILPIALVGFSPFGQTSTQFMIE